MTEVQPFVFPVTGQQVRTVMIGGQPWFVAADVCAVLGIGNPSQAVSYLDEDERGKFEVSAGQATLISNEGPSTSGNAGPNIVSEPGLYSLILRSRKAEAKAFKRWITHEVLPAIRQTGGYGTAATFDPTNLDHIVQLAQIAAEQKREIAAAKQQIAELEPDALAARQMADATGLSLVGQVAKRWDMTEKALREFLYAERLLIRGGDRRNDPTAYAMERDWMASKSRDVGDPPRRRGTTYITPKGELGIWRRRFERGHVKRALPPARQLSLVEAS